MMSSSSPSLSLPIITRLERIVIFSWLLFDPTASSAWIINFDPKKASASPGNSRRDTNDKLMKIEVCQNKDCCKRFSGKSTLVETLQDLLLPNDRVEITSSGCLSYCGKGPNINVHSSHNNNEKEIHGMRDATTVTSVLNELNDMEQDNTNTIPSTLLAAVTVMERSQQKDISWAQKEKYLNSVIQTLQKKDELSQSFAIAHAYTLRAKLFLERPNNHVLDENICINSDDHQAKQDAKHAIQLFYSTPSSTITTTATMTLPWRILLDIEKRQLSGEQTNGNDDNNTRIQNMIEIYQQWAKVNPSFRTKINKEVQELLEDNQPYNKLRP